MKNYTIGIFFLFIVCKSIVLWG